MKRLIAITALVSGILLLLVPRYILPACEYEGYPHMHCSDTAQAEFIIGGILMAVGITTFFLRQNWQVIVSAASACLLYGTALWLPEKIGYCRSTNMPCNYGMVPGIRFIAVAGAVVMVIAIINLLRTARKKGNS